MLSPESQTVLKALLPPTAFRGYQATLEPDHPSAVDSKVIDQPMSGPPSSALDISVFTDPHFLAAAYTFRDHIYSDWLSDAHAEKVKQFQAGVHDGTLSAPWKDDIWENNNKTDVPSLTDKEVLPSGSTVGISSRAGCGATSIIILSWLLICVLAKQQR
jgi:hypothetical protein